MLAELGESLIAHEALLNALQADGILDRSKITTEPTVELGPEPQIADQGGAGGEVEATSPQAGEDQTDAAPS